MSESEEARETRVASRNARARAAATDFLHDTQYDRRANLMLDGLRVEALREVAELALEGDPAIVTALSGLVKAVQGIPTLKGAELPFADELQAAEVVLAKIAPEPPASDPAF